MVQADNNATKVLFGLFTFVIFGQVYVLCYLGNIIESSSDEISSLITASDWYTKSKNLKFGLRMMCMQRSCVLTSGLAEKIDQTLVTGIVMNAYSLFNLLRAKASA